MLIHRDEASSNALPFTLIVFEFEPIGMFFIKLGTLIIKRTKECKNVVADRYDTNKGLYFHSFPAASMDE